LAPVFRGEYYSSYTTEGSTSIFVLLLGELELRRGGDLDLEASLAQLGAGTIKSIWSFTSRLDGLGDTMAFRFFPAAVIIILFAGRKP